MKARQVKKWICGVCKSQCWTKRNANACCKCPGCKKPQPGSGTYYCKQCAHESEVKDAKQRIVNAIDNYRTLLQFAPKEQTK